jgi:hypothetical protein
MARSRPLRGGWRSVVSGAGRAWRSSLPFAVRGSAGRRTNAAGKLASVDQLDRRLALSLNRVADEIRVDYPDFPVRVEPGSHDLVVAPFRPPREHFRH